MEIWRIGYANAERPKVLGLRNLTVALVLHVASFAVFWAYSAFHGLFDKEEEIIPIDLTIVVNENLKGKENEPPPLKKPEPEPPKPKPKPQPKKVKEPEKPKELGKIVTNVVSKVEKKEPEKPKKTAKELREEKMAEMRKRAKPVNKTVKIEVKNAKESGDGKTAKKTLSDAEIMKKLMEGYKPGTTTQLAANQEQLALSLIKGAFEEKWDKPPWTDTLKPMVVRVWFGGGGHVVKFKLEKSSGDAKADRSILSAAQRVVSVPALPAAFIDKYKSGGVAVRFTVTPQ